MVKNAEGAEVQSAECRVQNAECRVKVSLVGAIHESPENERIPQNKQSACHSERRKTLAFCEVELPRVERSEQAEARDL